MALKSAWELALERTGGKTTSKLTDAQKAKLAELDRIYTAKIAERELDLKPKIVAAGTPEDREKLEETLRAEIAKLRGKLEDEKDKIRQSA
jgi:DNA-binding transcriptional regulator PaaX